MLLFLALLSSGKHVAGYNPIKKNVREMVKYYQFTSNKSVTHYTKIGYKQALQFNQPVFKYAESYGSKNALRDKYGEYTYSGLLSSSITFAKKLNDAVQRNSGERIVFLCPNDASYIITLWACWIHGQTGVVLTHGNLQAQISSQIEAWQWQSTDVILHALPLHHIHGVVNALLTPLMVGAKCVMHSSFNPTEVWNEFLGVDKNHSDRVNVFMGVPTIYMNLLNEYDRSLTKNERIVEYVRATCTQKIRLMVCGSAPLPQQIFDWWLMVTGHSILERYGMTEIGMALSNPIDGEGKPGFVGTPMPGVRVRIMKQNEIPTSKEEILLEGDSMKARVFTSAGNVTGLLQVKGEGVFKHYWNKPEITASEFTDDGWFKTGDIVEYVENSYRILGRSSVDIIKTGGYKVSALQIEFVLLSHPDIVDVAVVGLPDITWGQKIAAIVQVKETSSVELRQVQHFVKERLPVYMMPSVLRVVEKIPRNALGKVNKKDIVSQLFNRTTV